jgi:hypothetical protein
MFNLNKTQTHENGQGLMSSAKQLPNGTTERNSLMNSSNEDYNPPLFKFKNKPSRAWLFMIAIGLLIFLKPEVGKGQCPIIDPPLDIPNVNFFNNNFLTSYTNNSDINSDIIFKKDPSDPTVTFYTLSNLTYQFHPDAKIIVEHGVKLILENCTFRTISSCPNLLWGGNSASCKF